MSAVAAPERSMRIGDLAKAAGTTTRTVRYYEEIGLLPRSDERVAGQHRVYTEAHLERLRELIRLKDLLGVSLDELGRPCESNSRRARAPLGGARSSRRPFRSWSASWP